MVGISKHVPTGSSEVSRKVRGRPPSDTLVEYNTQSEKVKRPEMNGSVIQAISLP